MKLSKSVLIIALLISPVIALAQQNNDWQLLEPKNEEFSVEVRTPFSAYGLEKSRTYYSTGYGPYLYVFTDRSEDRSNLKAIKKFVESEGKQLDIDGEIDHPQRISFHDKYGYWNNIVFIRTKHRSYLAQTASQEENDEMAKRFLSSFRVTESDLQNAPTNLPSTQEPAVNDGSQIKETESGIARDNGSGISNSRPGSDGGIISTPPPPIAGNIQPMRVSSKPRPGYTDLARLYQIQGVVILKVIFLDTAKIGEVSVVRGLPFGLTESAVDACKRMKFTPKMIDGKPQTVTKYVEFGFNTY